MIKMFESGLTLMMRDAADWWSCRRCWPKLDCACRGVLISAQHPIVYWLGSEKLMVLTWQVQSHLDSMGQNRLLVWLTSPVCTRTEQITQELLGSLTAPTPDFSSCSEECLLLLREEVLIETTELGRHNLIYIHCADLPWLIMEQEEELRAFAAYQQSKKQITHLHMTVECETDTLFFLNCPQKNANHMSAWPHIHAISVLITHNKCKITKKSNC